MSFGIQELNNMISMNYTIKLGCMMLVIINDYLDHTTPTQEYYMSNCLLYLVGAALIAFNLW